jgi:hypothetical protein
MMTIIIIGIGLAIYFFISDDKKIDYVTLNQNTSVNNINNKANASNPESNLDYKTIENLILMSSCYLNKYPNDVQYFPENLRDKNAYVPDKANEDDMEFIKKYCSNYTQEAFDYFAKLIRTDADKDGLNVYLEVIFSIDDNKLDTDNDGYNDLEEVVSGHNPNDLLTQKQNDARDRVSLLMQEDPINQKAIILACAALDIEGSALASQKDSCLEQASRMISDPTFCDKAKFTPNSYFYGLCKDNMIGSAAKTAEDGLKINSESLKGICIDEKVKELKSLAPCSLPGITFTECAWNKFYYLKDRADCDTYSILLGKDDFMECLFAVAKTTHDTSLCKEITNIGPNTCISQVQ